MLQNCFFALSLFATRSHTYYRSSLNDALPGVKGLQMSVSQMLPSASTSTPDGRPRPACLPPATAPHPSPRACAAYRL